MPLSSIPAKPPPLRDLAADERGFTRINQYAVLPIFSYPRFSAFIRGLDRADGPNRPDTLGRTRELNYAQGYFWWS